MRRRTSTDRLATPSLRRRAVLTVLSLLAAMLVVLVVVTSTVLQSRLEAQLRDRLTDRATFARGLADEVEPRELVRRLEGDDVSVMLRTTDGQTYTAGPPPAGAADTTPSSPATPGSPDGDGPPGPPDRPRAEQQVVRFGDELRIEQRIRGVGDLVLTADASTVSATVAQTRLILGVAAAVVLALAAAVLWPVLGRALAPLDQITGLARSISAGDRGRRLRPDRPGTELGRTASAFDTMLDDVERSESHALDSEQRLRTFVSDAAHELRTPVAGVRAAAEHLLRADPDREERERTLVSLVRESGRAGRLVDDMLLIARIDRGLEVRRESVDVHALALEVASTRRLTHPDARVEVDGAAVAADADGLRVSQVISNLVDNALRATDGHGPVRVTTASLGDEVVVDVRDDGPGIPAHERERVFERLVRLDGARSSPGFGLGLPIARGIARAHGGDLVCLGSDRGAHVRLTLPRAVVDAVIDTDVRGGTEPPLQRAAPASTSA